MTERALRWHGRVQTIPWPGPQALDREGATSPTGTPAIPHDADIVVNEQAWVVPRAPGGPSISSRDELAGDGEPQDAVRDKADDEPAGGRRSSSVEPSDPVAAGRIDRLVAGGSAGNGTRVFAAKQDPQVRFPGSHGGVLGCTERGEYLGDVIQVVDCPCRE